MPAAFLFGDRPWPELLAKKVSSSDYAWNMLAVSQELHTWWGMGLWAVKCLGVTPAGSKHMVTLQFRWMPERSRLLRSREINLEKGEGQKMLDELTTWHGFEGTPSSIGGPICATDGNTHQPLLSGQVFYVTLDSKEEADNMKDMVDLQWSLIVVASLAGAADPPELPDDDSDISDNDAMEVEQHDEDLVNQWLEGIEIIPNPRQRPSVTPSEDTMAG